MVEKNGDGSAAFLAFFGATHYRYLQHKNFIYLVTLIDFHQYLSAIFVCCELILTFCGFATVLRLPPVHHRQ
jgi:hypothetical protein